MMQKSLLACLIVLLAQACSARRPSHATVKDDDIRGIAFAPCAPNTKVETVCSISPTAVHPTQFALGYLDVEKKRTRLKKIKDSPEELEEYLRKKIVPAIKGPDFVYYIMDGHHTSRALAEESILVIYARVTADYSDLSLAEFLTRLKSENLLWLYDENGIGNQDPAKIPSKIMDLKDDPYRSLAEDAQEDGAFREQPVYFQQFMWANFFRKLIDKELLKSNYKKAVQEAVDWAKHPKAAHLPGYKD